MSAEQAREFTDLVRMSLPASEEELRSLWRRVAEEFNRVGGGPDAAKQYMDVTQRQLGDRVQGLLSEFEED